MTSYYTTPDLYKVLITCRALKSTIELVSIKIKIGVDEI